MMEARKASIDGESAEALVLKLVILRLVCRHGIPRQFCAPGGHFGCILAASSSFTQIRSATSARMT